MHITKQKRLFYKPGRDLSSEIKFSSTLILDFSTFRTVRNKFMFISRLNSTQTVEFSYCYFLVASGLSHGVQIFLGSCGIFPCSSQAQLSPPPHPLPACRILVPKPAIEPPSPALQGRVLTSGLPGKSLWNFVMAAQADIHN